MVIGLNHPKDLLLKCLGRKVDIIVLRPLLSKFASLSIEQLECNFTIRGTFDCVSDWLLMRIRGRCKGASLANSREVRLIGVRLSLRTLCVMLRLNAIFVQPFGCHGVAYLTRHMRDEWPGFFG